MKILIDGSLPRSLSDRPNPEGIVVHRVAHTMDDAALVVYASEHGYAAVVVSEPEVLAQERVRELARKHSVALVCSVTDDPEEVETNLRHALRSLVDRTTTEPGGLFRVGKSGAYPADGAPKK